MSTLDILGCLGFSYGIFMTYFAFYWKEQARKSVKVNSRFGYGVVHLRDKYPQFTLDKTDE